MGQLGLFVLLASIVAGCISDSIPAINTKSSAESSESDDSTDFPTEFMDNLIASLSPEEVEALSKPIILTDFVNRDANAAITPCRKYEDIRYYYHVAATDGEKYYVISSHVPKYQPIIHYACDKREPYDYKCEPANPTRFYGYCCHQHKTTTFMKVIPVPRRRLEVRNSALYYKGTDKKYENYTITSKEVFVNSDCICDKSITSLKWDYTCPNPDSKMFLYD